MWTHARCAVGREERKPEGLTCAMALRQQHRLCATRLNARTNLTLTMAAWLHGGRASRGSLKKRAAREPFFEPSATQKAA